MQRTREELGANVVAGSLAARNLEGSSIQGVVIAALADGLAEMEIASHQGLGRLCSGDPSGSIPVFVRPYHPQTASGPRAVLTGIRLLSTVTSSAANPDVYDVTKPQVPEARRAVAIKNIVLSSRFDQFKSSRLGPLVDSMDVDTAVNDIRKGNAQNLGFLQMEYSVPSTSAEHVSNLYYGVMTGRTTQYTQKYWFQKLGTESDDCRLARNACPADQVAAGASFWAKTEYYGIGSEPEGEIDKFNWDFERVNQWAKEAELLPVAEVDFVAVYAHSRDSGVTTQHPSKPFQSLVETCGQRGPQKDLIYESEAFFYAQ